MRVLVIGGAGYIGSVLCPFLKEKGEEAIVFDNFIYRKGGNVVRSDITDFNELSIEIQKADAVIQLAGLSNDPLSNLDPKVTWEVNYLANVTIAKLLRNTNKRIIFASSCSVYGFSLDTVFNEDSKPHPVTLYARTKMLSEEEYLKENINSIVLRLATVYGYSPSCRLDLVVNTMIASSYFRNKIVVNNGRQWRPIIHVKDVAQAIYLSLYMDNPNQIYNVGTNDQNFKVTEIGHRIHYYLKEKPKLIYDDKNIDNRSYRVNFDKIIKLGFKCQYDIEDAVEELYRAFEDKRIKSMNEDVYYRVKYLKKCHLP